MLAHRITRPFTSDILCSLWIEQEPLTSPLNKHKTTGSFASIITGTNLLYFYNSSSKTKEHSVNISLHYLAKDNIFHSTKTQQHQSVVTVALLTWHMTSLPLEHQHVTKSTDRLSPSISILYCRRNISLAVSSVRNREVLLEGVTNYHLSVAESPPHPLIH